MASIIYIVLLLILCFILLWCLCRVSKGKRSILPTNWKIIRLIQGSDFHRLHDYVTKLLRRNGGTVEFKGPWFANVSMLVTCDPANVHYILSKNFTNFGKGPQFKKIFAILGDGIFGAEADSWDMQRKTTYAILHHQGFIKFLVTSTWDKVEKGLIPVLDHVTKLGTVVDLQDIIHRFAFDITCLLMLDYDPVLLSDEFPNFPVRQAFADAEEAILYRHILPETVWRLQSWFQLGREQKLTKAAGLIDEFLADQIASKREKQKNMDNILSEKEGCFDFLIGYMETLADKIGASNISDKTWRDSMLSLIFAGKDTTGAALTWFFWLIATNPIEENKVREEIIRNLHVHDVGGLSISNVEELNKLVYLHGALCETLRLFPSVALQHKAPIEADILPSGHRLKPNQTIVLSFYSMGRMEQIWGKDYMEFKPERWLSKQGGIKHVPSFKFTAFNAGPRNCLGKEMSFILLKIVAAALIYHFEFKVVEGQTILPTTAVVLNIKDGLKVRVTRRSVHQ